MTDESESAAQEAHRLVHGDRGEDYGHPFTDFSKTAQIVQGILMQKLAPHAQITPEDVGLIMIAVKMSRHTNRPKRDNLVDIAGYAETLEMIRNYRMLDGVEERY